MVNLIIAVSRRTWLALAETLSITTNQLAAKVQAICRRISRTRELQTRRRAAENRWADDQRNPADVQFWPAWCRSLFWYLWLYPV